MAVGKIQCFFLTSLDYAQIYVYWHSFIRYRLKDYDSGSFSTNGLMVSKILIPLCLIKGGR